MLAQPQDQHSENRTHVYTVQYLDFRNQQCRFLKMLLVNIEQSDIYPQDRFPIA